jgi:hypothetical protein
MSEIALHQDSLDSKIAYSKALAVSKLLPPDYRNNPANILMALEYASSLGVKPIHAITAIHVISGKPSASASLIAALVRRAGHKLRVVASDTEATATLIRADDPDFEYKSVWTMQRAKAAGLLSNPSWQKYPAAMLGARATTEVARQGASDAILGLSFTPEELGEVVDASGAPVGGPVVKDTPRRVTAADVLDEPVDAEVVDPDADAAQDFLEQTP